MAVTAQGLAEPVINSNSSERIVAEALTWLGTPYHHAADVKGAGVDCAMFLVRVFVDAGLVPAFDPRPYPPYFYLHSSEPKYVSWISQYGIPVDAERPGDVATFSFGRSVSHGAICLGDDRIIHAYEKARKVEITELRSSPELWKRFNGFWRIKV